MATDPTAAPFNGEPEPTPNEGVPPVAPAEGDDDTPGELPGSPRE